MTTKPSGGEIGHPLLSGSLCTWDLAAFDYGEGTTVGVAAMELKQEETAIERINGEDFRDVQRESKKAQLFQAVTKAHNITRAAEIDAAQIVAQAEQDAFNLRQTARADGLESGRQEAINTILSGAQFLPMLLGRLKELIIECSASLAQAVLSSTDAVILDALRSRISCNISYLEAVMTRLAGNSKILVHVAANEAELVRQEISSQQHDGVIEVVPDTSLASGDMVIESQLGRIDGRTTTHLEILGEFLSNSHEMTQHVSMTLKRLL